MSADGRAPEPTPSADGFYSPLVRTRRTASAVLSELRQPVRRRFPPHGHERAYVSLLFGGSYVERYGSRALEHRPPTLAYHPPGLEHQDEVGEAGARFLIVELDPGWVENVFSQGPAAGGPRTLEGERALRAAWRLRRSLAGRSEPCGLSTEGLVLDLLEALYRDGAVRERSRPGWLDGVIERLHAEYREPVSLARLAADAGVHPAHLWRAFRRAEGCSPSAYLHRLRCRHVFRKLSERSGEASLADLALEAGFADQSHLTRVFGRLVGLPPGALRRELSS